MWFASALQRGLDQKWLAHQQGYFLVYLSCLSASRLLHLDTLHPCLWCHCSLLRTCWIISSTNQGEHFTLSFHPCWCCIFQFVHFVCVRAQRKTTKKKKEEAEEEEEGEEEEEKPKKKATPKNKKATPAKKKETPKKTPKVCLSHSQFTDILHLYAWLLLVMLCLCVHICSEESCEESYFNQKSFQQEITCQKRFIHHSFANWSHSVVLYLSLCLLFDTFLFFFFWLFLCLCSTISFHEEKRCRQRS